MDELQNSKVSAYIMHDAESLKKENKYQDQISIIVTFNWDVFLDFGAVNKNYPGPDLHLTPTTCRKELKWHQVCQVFTWIWRRRLSLTTFSFQILSEAISPSQIQFLIT